MGGLKKQLQAMEREAHITLVLSECERVCNLFNMPVGPIQEAALALINGPLDDPDANWDGVDLARETLRQDAIQRGFDPDQMEAEVTGLIAVMYKAQFVLAQPAHVQRGGNRWAS